MFIYDYPPYLGPPLTNEEKEEYEKVWQKLREEGKGIEPSGRLNLAVFKTVSLANSGTLQEPFTWLRRKSPTVSTPHIFRAGSEVSLCKKGDRRVGEWNREEHEFAFPTLGCILCLRSKLAKG